MGRYLGPVCKLNRRYGVDLQLKGRNSNGGTKKKSPPGGQVGRKKQLSEYGKQLRAKQIVKRWYNVQEKQFKRTFQEAVRRKGKTGDNLLMLLETRLDNIVYISHLAISKRQARQLVSHRHIMVNGQIVNIPSFKVKEGDVVEVVENFKKNRLILESLKNVSSVPVPNWLNIEVDEAKVKILSMPERADIQVPAEEQLIVELYSK
jgi:small subunit ribosomal protein S4